MDCEDVVYEILKNLDPYKYKINQLWYRVSMIDSLYQPYCAIDKVHTFKETAITCFKIKSLIKQCDLKTDVSSLYKEDILVIYSKKLKTLPEINLPNLKFLNLNDNDLTSIPEINLINLKYLSIDHNQVTHLQKLNTPKLKQLSLYYNQLTIFPKIEQLINLTYLDLSQNRLIKLPKRVCRLINLKSLYLGNNQLIVLPSEIGQLTKLSSLSVLNNQLTTCPPEVGQLIQLRYLNLNENYLTVLPQEIKNLHIPELYVNLQKT